MANICHSSFNVKRTYSCLQKVVVLIKLWLRFSCVIFVDLLRKCRTITLVASIKQVDCVPSRQCARIFVLLSRQSVTWWKRQHEMMCAENKVIHVCASVGVTLPCSVKLWIYTIWDYCLWWLVWWWVCPSPDDAAAALESLSVIQPSVNRSVQNDAITWWMV